MQKLQQYKKIKKMKLISILIYHFYFVLNLTLFVNRNKTRLMSIWIGFLFAYIEQICHSGWLVMNLFENLMIELVFHNYWRYLLATLFMFYFAVVFTILILSYVIVNTLTFFLLNNHIHFWTVIFFTHTFLIKFSWNSHLPTLWN